MTNAAPAGRARTPKLLWVIGILALLWNSFGCLDYTMTQTRNAAWLAQYTPEQMAFIDSYPSWAIAGWAFGVWGGAVGSLLLLLRKRLSAPVYLVSLLGAVTSHIYYLFLSNGPATLGGGAGAYVFPVVIIAIALGLYLYARAMAAKQVLV